MGTNLLKFQGGIRLGNLATAPTGQTGVLYYDTAASEFKFYNGTSFVEVADFDQLGSATGTTGSDLIGDDNTYSNFTPTAATVKGALAGIDSALATAASNEFADNLFRIKDNGDATKKIAFEASGITTATTRTITMPDSNVNLGLIATAIQRDGSVAFTANQAMGGFKLTGLAAGTSAGDSVRYEQAILVSGANAFTADQSMGGFKLTNLATPTSASDAATKSYVDGVANGLDIKASVRVATTANITLSGAQTIDGVSAIAGDRVLVKDQTAPEENGIWVVAAGAWSRAGDMDAWAEVPGAFTFVEEGSTNADRGFVCTSNAGGTLGTTAITWVQFSAAGSYLAGNGILLTGSTFSVRHDGEGLTFSGSDLALELDGSTLSKSASGVKVASGGITNTEVNASAAIAYSKLNLSNSIVNADINASAAIAYSKLNLSGSIVNADISASAAIAYSKLNLSASIVNADISASAAIALSKLAALTANRALASDGSGVISATSVTSTELGYLSGVTSAIQTQINDKVTGPASATDNALVRFDSTTGKLVQNSTSELSDTGGLTIGDTFKRGDSGLTDVVEEEYMHGVSLTASTTAVLSNLTFDSRNYKAMIVDYQARNGNNRRVGKLMIVCDNASGVAASNVSIVPYEAETTDINLTWAAAVNGNNIEISYTTSSGTYVVNLDVKRIKP